MPLHTPPPLRPGRTPPSVRGARAAPGARGSARIVKLYIAYITLHNPGVVLPIPKQYYSTFFFSGFNLNN